VSRRGFARLIVGALVAPLLLASWSTIARGGPGGPALSANCREAVIRDADAQRLFDALRAPGAGDGCTLEGVRTERTWMKVMWVQDGRAIDAVTILPVACAEQTSPDGPVFSVAAPSDAVAACPASLARLRALVASHVLPGLAPIEDSASGASPRGVSRWAAWWGSIKSWRWLGYAPSVTVVIALALVFLLADKRLRLRARASSGSGALVSPARKPAPSILRRCGGLLVALTISSLSLELGLRGYIHYIHPIGRFLASIYRQDRDTDFSLQPDLRIPVNFDVLDLHFTFDTNHRGLRGRDELPPKAPDEYRILMLGDSFVFGFGVESDQTFSTLLQDGLSARVSRPVRVVNAGVPGYGTVQELKYYTHNAGDLLPNLVVLGFFENDYRDNMKHVVFADGYLMSDPVLFAGHPSVALEFISKRVLHPGRLYLDGDAFDGTVDESRTHALLQDLLAACRDGGRPLLVLNIPDRQKTKFMSSPSDPSEHHAPLPLPDEVIVDLLPSIENAQVTPYLRDGHLNAEGHVLAAEALVSIVTKIIKKEPAPQ
jgi:hypothetical protein